MVRQRAKQRLAETLTSGSRARVLRALVRGRARHHGLDFDVSTWDPTSAAKAILGMYEKSETKFIRRYLRGAEVAIELGSSRGVTGSHLLDVMAPGGTLVAVEANPQIIDELGVTLRRAAGSRAVSVIWAAVAGADGTGHLRISESTAASRLADDGAEVPTMTLTTISSMVPSGPFVLVSDIEGAEASFILGEGDVLSECSRMVIELHDAEWLGERTSRDDLLTALVGRGFRCLDNRGAVYALERAGARKASRLRGVNEDARRSVGSDRDATRPVAPEARDI